MDPKFFDLAALETQRAGTRIKYTEFLRVATMSAGIYVIPAGGGDPQEPHGEDEFYYVLRGRARMTTGQSTRSVSTGSIIFVPAAVEHRFHDIEEDLAVLVVFAPAETS